MAERVTVERISDLSGGAIAEDQQWQAHVNHPDTPEAPTARLDITPEEAEMLRKLASPAVRVALLGPDPEAGVEEVSIPVAKFEQLFKPLGRKAVEVLAEAPVVGKRVRTPGNGHGDTGRDYASPEWAGTPKKGKTSAEEAEYVRTHFDEVNERLKRDGMRVIDLGNADHVSRYGLQELVAARANQPAPEAPAQ